MVVCLPLSPLFSSCDSFSEQVDEVLFGEEVEVVEEFEDFCHIVTDYGYSGWLKKSSIREKIFEANYTVKSTFCDLLFSGKNFFRPAMTLPRGSRIFAEEIESSRYLNVTTQERKNFFVLKDHVEKIKPIEKTEEKLRETITKTAKNYLGTPYRWGGRTNLGIDCSGLCFNAYRESGIKIWRDADITKSKALREIPFCQLKTADLMFFEGHVAMWLGRGEIIHSSFSNGSVVIERFEKNDKLKEIFICAGTAF